MNVYSHSIGMVCLAGDLNKGYMSKNLKSTTHKKFISYLENPDHHWGCVLKQPWPNDSGHKIQIWEYKMVLENSVLFNKIRVYE